MSIKPHEALRFLGGLAVACGLAVAGCAPAPEKPPPEPAAIAPRPAGPATRAECFHVRGWAGAARTNKVNLRSLEWAPFGRPERGWETYAPLIQREIGTPCAPDTAGFAAAWAQWQGDQRLLPTGVVNEEDFLRLKGVLQTRRAFVRLASLGVCPEPARETALAEAKPGEGYAGKAVQLRPAAFDAYRRMVGAARAEEPAIAREPRYLTIFSAFRSPAYDAERCAREGNCDGIARATCSPHRTGLAMDLYVGEAPGFGPDSSADASRRFMAHSPAYRWLVRNAARFGFVNYPFEPWHWEWTGEDP